MTEPVEQQEIPAWDTQTDRRLALGAPRLDARPLRRLGPLRRRAAARARGGGVRLRGQVGVVTGTSRGLGARSSSPPRQKVHAFVAVARNAEAGEAAVRGGANGGGDALFLQGRRAERAGRRAADRSAASRSTGRSTSLSTTPAFSAGTAARTTNELWDDLVATHLTGTFWGCKHAIAAMRESGRGGAYRPTIARSSPSTGDGYLAAYTAMKSGVLGLTKAIAIDYALDGIRCNCVPAR